MKPDSFRIERTETPCSACRFSLAPINLCGWPYEDQLHAELGAMSELDSVDMPDISTCCQWAARGGK